MALCMLLIAYYSCLPKQLFTSPTSYVLEDSNGDLLNASIAPDGQWRFPFSARVLELVQSTAFWLALASAKIACE